jgi:hypothetical protein
MAVVVNASGGSRVNPSQSLAHSMMLEAAINRAADLYRTNRSVSYGKAFAVGLPVLQALTTYLVVAVTAKCANLPPALADRLCTMRPSTTVQSISFSSSNGIVASYVIADDVQGNPFEHVQHPVWMIQSLDSRHRSRELACA